MKLSKKNIIISQFLVYFFEIQIVDKIVSDFYIRVFVIFIVLFTTSLAIQKLIRKIESH